ncbi:MAG: hypothetical protein U0350_36405 [Caldilineaceae bacterium]
MMLTFTINGVQLVVTVPVSTEGSMQIQVPPSTANTATPDAAAIEQSSPRSLGGGQVIDVSWRPSGS